MTQEINIGDTVRFLNSVGGGKVTAFKKNGLVLVEDEDGFEIPVLQSEVVIVPQEEKPKSAFSISKQKEEPSKAYSQPVTAKDKPTVLSSALTRAKQETDKTNEETETLEERVLRLEMTIRKLTRRIERLEDAKSLREKIKGEQLQQRDQQRKAKDDVIEVDLHIDELLDTTVGMSAVDIKEYQLETFRNTMNEHLNEKGRRIIFIHGNGDGVLRKAILSELHRNYKSCESQDASFQQYGFGATMVIIH